MILELNGTKVTIVDKTLGYQGDNLVNTIQVTVDKDSTWNYKLDMYKGKSKCFDSVLMTREGNVCIVQLTNEILSYGGRYIFQLRGYTDTQTYHSDIFESWVNASIEYQYDCEQADCGCDCKLPTEFYQVEDNVTEINNHPPYPGDNGKWMIWDVDKHEYVESDIDVVGGGTDISLGITSAAVGDIVKVKAVDADGKPTEWEAAAQETWEKLVDVTLEEAVDTVTYTFDNCKRIKALINPVLSAMIGGWKKITVNNIVYLTLNMNIQTHQGVYYKISSEYPPYVEASLDVVSGTSVQGINGGARTAVLENIAPDGITQFGCSTPGILTAGTKIQIWGVKS
uniref:Uncharacterized protein n=1 Tax=Siphoviridae sp. ctBCr48 TaxID=2827802 RepID=A0A8S5SH22_9CAUD|nr:MAG TPA: hypothetical protein [Siphoviridae sp. ctBCr48]